MRARSPGHSDYFDAPFLALAHRGGISTAAPAEVENSLRAFQAAWDLGYRHLETDVHVTADGVLVAFHDDVLERVTDASGRLADLPWSQISRARIGGSEQIPLLDDLLDALPHARLNIDLKVPAAIGPLITTLDRHRAHRRVCVGSFSSTTIGAFRRLTEGRVATSASPVEVAVFGLLPGVRRRWPLRADAFQMPIHEPRTGLRLLSRGMLAAAHARGAYVHVWTVNDRPTMERLIEMGVDGIVTDELDLLKAVLVARDLWWGHA